MQQPMTRRLGALAAAAVVAVTGFAVTTSTADAAGGKCKALWVSPDGSDQAAGSESAPFATPERARDEIRDKKLNAHMGCDVTVNVREIGRAHV